MNNPNPFLPQSSFLEQKNKARARLRIVVLSSISLSAMVMFLLLIQGCRKNDAGQAPDQTGAAPAPELASNPPPETSVAESAGTTNNPGMQPPPPVEPTPPPQATPPPAPPDQTTATSDYTVVKGDTLDAIHKKTGVSVKAIEQANPGVDPKRLKIGQKLHVPAANSTPAAMSTNPGGATETAPAGGEQTYKVKSGDTLTGIAKKFHVPIKAIQSANDLKTTSIRVGQTLKIPSKAAPAPDAAPAETAPPAPASTPTMPPPTLQPATPTNH